MKKECIKCKNSLAAWLSSLNYDKDKEEAIRENSYNYCPVCISSKKNKGRN